MNITIEEFVTALWQCHKEPITSLLHYGHLRGWLEDQDEREPHSILVKRTAARILHQFMKIELKIPDLVDISPADELKDLYTCRVCVNHVAQVYLRNLMSSEEILQGNETIRIFNMMKTVSEEETFELVRKIKSFIK